MQILGEFFRFFSEIFWLMRWVGGADVQEACSCDWTENGDC